MADDQGFMNKLKQNGIKAGKRLAVVGAVGVGAIGAYSIKENIEQDAAYREFAAKASQEDRPNPSQELAVPPSENKCFTAGLDTHARAAGSEFYQTYVVYQRVCGLTPAEMRAKAPVEIIPDFKTVAARVQELNSGVFARWERRVDPKVLKNKSFQLVP